MEVRRSYFRAASFNIRIAENFSGIKAKETKNLYNIY
mgnify:CR=1 FL=1